MSQEESEHNEVDGMKKGVDSTGEVMQSHVTCSMRNVHKHNGHNEFN